MKTPIIIIKISNFPTAGSMPLYLPAIFILGRTPVISICQNRAISVLIWLVVFFYNFSVENPRFHFTIQTNTCKANLCVLIAKISTLAYYFKRFLKSDLKKMFLPQFQNYNITASLETAFTDRTHIASLLACCRILVQKFRNRLLNKLK